MLGFLKKLFGMDKETMKDAGVQLEQPSAPYKVEPPATTPIPLVVEKLEVKEVIAVPVEEKKVEAKVKKPRGPKKPQGPKPTTKPAAPKKPRKPKQVK
jgi:hypothetical protein